MIILALLVALLAKILKKKKKALYTKIEFSVSLGMMKEPFNLTF